MSIATADHKRGRFHDDGHRHRRPSSDGASSSDRSSGGPSCAGRNDGCACYCDASKNTMSVIAAACALQQLQRRNRIQQRQQQCDRQEPVSVIADGINFVGWVGVGALPFIEDRDGSSMPVTPDCLKSSSEDPSGSGTSGAAEVAISSLAVVAVSVSALLLL